MQVQLQEPKAGTCVACATVNALRVNGLDAPVEDVIEALRVKRFHGRDGSFVVKAAMYLRREHGMDVVISRPPHKIMDPVAAAEEVARRFEALLDQGYVGLIRRKETPKEGHVCVLRQVLWKGGEPFFVCYDSNKRQTRGEWVYRVQDYVFWEPDKMDLKIDFKNRTIETEDHPPTPTGRVGYFVRPGRLGNAVWNPKKSPFRARERRRPGDGDTPVTGDSRVTGNR